MGQFHGAYPPVVTNGGSGVKKGGWRGLHWRYFFSYFLLMLVVLAILLVYTYSSFYSFHSQIVLSKYSDALNQIRATTESNLSQLIAVTTQFTTSSDVSPFDFEKEPDKAVALIRQLGIFRAATDSVSDLFLRFDGSDYLFSSTSTYSVERFVREAAVFDGMTAGELLERLNGTSRLQIAPAQIVSGYVRNTHNVSRKVVPVFVPVRYLNTVKCGTAMFLIEESTYIERFTTAAGSTCDVYFMDGQTPLVSHCVSGVPLESLLEARDAQQGTLVVNGQKYHLLSMDGNGFSYHYIMLVSDGELGAAMSGSVSVMALVAALCMALGVLLITRMVQNRVKPIRLLYSMLSDRAPSGNELIELRDAVQGLVDKNAAMSEKIESMEELRKADFARRFFVGGFESEDEFLAMAEEIRLNADFPCFAVCVLAKPAQSDYELTADKLNHMFDETVHGVARQLGLTGKLALVAFADGEERIITFLESKFGGLRACCPGITMAVSDIHHGFQEGQRAYLEAESAFELRFIRGNARMIRFDGLVGMGGGDYDQRAVERLRQALRANDPKRVQAALSDISRAMREIQTSLFAFRCMYTDILNVVNAEARALNRGEREVYDLFQLSQCLSLDELDIMLHNVCSQLMAGRDAAAPAPDAPEAVRAARDMILRRFSEADLSVSTVARQVGMSDSKLSVAFKAAYHMTPLEFLTSQRMKQARRLLCTTDMPVKDVALECGYYDISSFNRRFKQYTGMTPQQYRQADRGENQTETSREEEP